MNEMLLPQAQLYATQRQLEIREPLGSGKDGIVLSAAARNSAWGKVAIKVFRFDELFLREKQVYQRLGEKRVSSVIGFNVPEMLHFDDSLHIIEMTIVERPFVLDFAGAYLDERPQFPEEIWAEWESDKREQFEDRWPEVRKILDAFEELGIYLLDVSPANLAFP